MASADAGEVDDDAVDVLGLVVGIGGAFLVDTLDERIRNVQDLERRLPDATVVVADSRSTERRAIRRPLQQLHQIGAPVVGIVLNGLPEGGDYGYGYGYSNRYTSNRVSAAAASRA
jgi:hypothetical protein